MTEWNEREREKEVVCRWGNRKCTREREKIEKMCGRLFHTIFYINLDLLL